MKHARADYNRFQEPDELLDFIDHLMARSWLQPEEDRQKHKALSRKYRVRRGTPIAEDEPVFLLRAQDGNFLLMLSYYAVHCPEEMESTVREHYLRATAWQLEHGSKAPDLHPEEEVPCV